MLILTKSLFALMIGFIIAVILGLILIPVLRKMKIGQRISIYVEKTHKQKEGTPTMGGLIFLIATLAATLLLLLLGKIEYSTNLLIVLFVMVGYALIGFIDDFISIRNKRNKGLTELQKLFLQFLVALVFFFLFHQTEMADGSSITVIENTFLGIKIDLGWMYGVFILFMLVGSSNAVNLTDGLDGLAGGLSAIAILSFGILAWDSAFLEGYQDIAVFCFVLAGAVIGFLVFNTHPSKVFMGDTGSLSLGAVLATVAILTRHELILIVIGGVFVIETLASIIQIISVKYFHKKIFLMAPLHHHFEKLGWKEPDIVKLFWIVGFLLAMLALIYGVWL